MRRRLAAGPLEGDEDGSAPVAAADITVSIEKYEMLKRKVLTCRIRCQRRN